MDLNGQSNRRLSSLISRFQKNALPQEGASISQRPEARIEPRTRNTVTSKTGAQFNDSAEPLKCPNSSKAELIPANQSSHWPEAPKVDTENNFVHDWVAEVTSPASDVEAMVTDKTSPASEVKTTVSKQTDPASEVKTTVTNKTIPASEIKPMVTEETSPASKVKTLVTDKTSPASKVKLTVTEETSPASEGKTTVTEKTSPASKVKPTVAEEKNPASEVKTIVLKEIGPASQVKTTVTKETSPASEVKPMVTDKTCPVDEVKIMVLSEIGPASEVEPTVTDETMHTSEVKTLALKETSPASEVEPTVTEETSPASESKTTIQPVSLDPEPNNQTGVEDPHTLPEADTNVTGEHGSDTEAEGEKEEEEEEEDEIPEEEEDEDVDPDSSVDYYDIADFDVDEFGDDSGDEDLPTLQEIYQRCQTIRKRRFYEDLYNVWQKNIQREEHADAMKILTACGFGKGDPDEMGDGLDTALSLVPERFWRHDSSAKEISIEDLKMIVEEKKDAEERAQYREFCKAAEVGGAQTGQSRQRRAAIATGGGQSSAILHNYLKMNLLKSHVPMYYFPSYLLRFQHATKRDLEVKDGSSSD